jgi:hypothetical protein
MKNGNFVGYPKFLRLRMFHSLLRTELLIAQSFHACYFVPLVSELNETITPILDSIPWTDSLELLPISPIDLLIGSQSKFNIRRVCPRVSLPIG